jgi:hypothetical protein
MVFFSISFPRLPSFWMVRQNQPRKNETYFGEHISILIFRNLILDPEEHLSKSSN